MRLARLRTPVNLQFGIHPDSIVLLCSNFFDDTSYITLSGDDDKMALGMTYKEAEAEINAAMSENVT